MSNTKKQLLALLNKEKLSDADKRWLYQYLENSDDGELEALLQQEFTNALEDKETPDLKFYERTLAKIYGKINIKTEERPRVVFMWIKRIAVAASVIGMMCAGYYLYVNNKKQNHLTTRIFKNDVKPGSEKAVLVLANGQKIVLDTARNGTISNQGNIKVIKINGKIAYNGTGANEAEITFNTIYTPRGGRYQVELPDGSQVWLNAASSLRFPTSFKGSERRVEITGEAYFEVAKNKQMPFIVKVNASEVRVLGTHFNINAYSDESTVTTTLLEGAVQFTNGSSVYTLKPGDQAELSTTGQVKLLQDVDLDNVVAWKNGLLHFENEDIKTVMRKLSRWYNIEAVYNTNVKDHFFAEIPSKSNLSEVLKALELTGKVKFGIDGRTIVIN